MKKLGCLVVLALLAFGGFYVYSHLHPPRVGGVPFSQLSAQTKKERRADADKLVKNVEGIARAAKKHEKKTFDLTVTEPQLNTLLQDRIKTEKFVISDLRAGLTPDLLTLQGTIKIKGFDVPATMEGTLGAKDGALVFDVKSLSLTGLSAPDGIKEKAQQTIQENLRKAFSKESKAKIDKVTIGTGKMTIQGRTG